MGGGADGPALYCVHPAGGDVLGFRELSSSPATRRPLYGLQAPPWHDTSVPDLAAHYVARILDLQPRGPYPLLGWSMGGLVALEMAQRLTASGHEVPMLVLVESYFTERTDAAALLTHFVANLSAMAGADIVVDHVGLSLPAGIDAIFDAAARAGFHPSASERDQLAGRLLLTHAHSVAAERFEPRSYLGPVTLVQAADQPPALRRAASSRWRSLCPGLTAVRTIPGDHLSLFHQPFVNELAQLVDNALTAYRG
jgi:thioesterase domain-containing protein